MGSNETESYHPRPEYGTGIIAYTLVKSVSFYEMNISINSFNIIREVRHDTLNYII